MKKEVRDIIEKWYRALPFPEKFDNEFFSLLDACEVSDGAKFSDYDLKCKDGGSNLLHFLYFSEELSLRYKAKGISEDILMDTLYDLVIWTEKYSKIEGRLYLGELEWLKHSFEMKLFRLGSLQFCLAPTSNSIPSHGVTPGDYVLHIHIPTGASLKPEDCRASLSSAIDFFGKYYKETEYKCFICLSWMLDSKLKGFLSEDSNILKFRNMFDIIYEMPNNSCIKFIFGWDTTEENLEERPALSSLAKKVKEAVLSGEKMNASLGAISTKDVLSYTL